MTIAILTIQRSFQKQLPNHVSDEIILACSLFPTQHTLLTSKYSIALSSDQMSCTAQLHKFRSSQSELPHRIMSCARCPILRVNIPWVRWKWHPDRLLPRTISLWNRLPRQRFSSHYNLNVFKYKANCYKSYISS